MTIEFLQKVFSEFGYSRCFDLEQNLKKNSAFKSYDKVFSFYNNKKYTNFIITFDNIKHKNQIAISVSILNYCIHIDDINNIFSKLSKKMRSPNKKLIRNILYLFENIKNIQSQL